MSNSDFNSALGIARTTTSELGIAGMPERVTNRYIDRYRTAESIIRAGRMVKIVGAIAGILVIVLGCVLAAITRGEISDAVLIACLGTGAGTIFAAFIAGIVVSAQGHQLIAALDSAVHSSPFLDNSAKARAMNL